MDVGTIGAGRIGLAAMRRLKPFDVKLHYSDVHRLPAAIEAELGATYHTSAASLVRAVDAVLVNCPLHPGTEHMFDARLLATMRRGAYIVNNARGKIMDAAAVVAALQSGQLAGYAGDVSFPQPPPRDHPWRTMVRAGGGGKQSARPRDPPPRRHAPTSPHARAPQPHNAMTPHISGTSLSAQARYAAGVREILECHFDGKPIREEYYIVRGRCHGGA